MGRITFVKETLAQNKLSYAWLMNELIKQGFKVRPSDLSSLFGDKAESILEASTDIVANYVRNNG